MQKPDDDIRTLNRYSCDDTFNLSGVSAYPILSSPHPHHPCHSITFKAASSAAQARAGTRVR